MFPTLPLKAWLIGGVAVAALGATGAFCWVARGWQADAQINALQARYAGERAAQTEAARKWLQGVVDDQGKIANDAQTKLDAAGVALSAANAASDGLRGRVAALLAAARGRATTPANSAAAGDPLGVLADVLDRADQRAGVLADYADRSRIAGLACEASYQALTNALQPAK